MTIDTFVIGNLEKNFLLKRQSAMKKSRADLVMLLNTDISVANYEKSLRMFRDPKLFAITFSPNSSKSGKVIRVDQANGGSSIYKRKIWNEIGGIDMMYEPYWFDDADYSRRAINMGYYIVEDGRIGVKQKSRMGTDLIRKSLNGQLIFWRNFFLYHKQHRIPLGRRHKYLPLMWPFIIWANIRYRKYHVM